MINLKILHSYSTFERGMFQGKFYTNIFILNFLLFFLKFFFYNFQPPYMGQMSKNCKNNFKSVIRTHKSIVLCVLYMQYMQNPNFFHIYFEILLKISDIFLRRTPRTESNDLIMPTTI